MDFTTNKIGAIASVEGNKPVVEYIGQSVLVSASTTITTPTIDRAVDGSYLAIMSQCSSARAAVGTMENWTSIATFGTTSFQGSVAYKILELSDSGTRYNSEYGGTQYDQILFFRNTTGQSFRRVRAVGATVSTATGAISSTLSMEASTKQYGPTFIAIHYFFSSTSTNPIITYDTAMTRVNNTGSTLTGMSYAIYNKTIPSQLTHTATSALTGTARQVSFWLELY